MRRFRQIVAAALLAAAFGGIADMPRPARVPVRLAPAVHLTRPASAIQG